ncbi:MAG: hypothetical protein QMC01_00990 [Pseudomonadales bacterium]
MMDRDRRLKSLIETLDPETQAIRVGMDRTGEREHSEPIYPTSTIDRKTNATLTIDH